MKLKNWFLLVFFQFFGIGWAILIFASPLARSMAGLVAGLVFLLVALMPILFLRTDPQKMKWISYWSAWLFLILIVLPTLYLRLFNWSVPFSELQLLGIPAEQIHAWATSFYMGLMLSTWVDGFRFYVWPRIRAGH